MSRISDKVRVLVSPRVTKHLSFLFLAPSWVFSDALKIFDLQGDALFATLQSSIHEAWARATSSTLGQTMRYSTSDSFDTFVFPKEVQESRELASKGSSFLSAREVLQKKYRLGLTDLYNRFHAVDETNADIQELRHLFVEMDNAVAAAYEWSGRDLGHGFRNTKQGVRFTLSERAGREVLSQLLELNHERYEEEVRQGLHEKQKATVGKGRRMAATRDDMPELFK